MVELSPLWNKMKRNNNTLSEQSKIQQKKQSYKEANSIPKKKIVLKI